MFIQWWTLEHGAQEEKGSLRKTAREEAKVTTRKNVKKLVEVLMKNDNNIFLIRKYNDWK